MLEWQYSTVLISWLIGHCNTIRHTTLGSVIKWIWKILYPVRYWHTTRLFNILNGSLCARKPCFGWPSRIESGGVENQTKNLRSKKTPVPCKNLDKKGTRLPLLYTVRHFLISSMLINVSCHSAWVTWLNNTRSLPYIYIFPIYPDARHPARFQHTLYSSRAHPVFPTYTK